MMNIRIFYTDRRGKRVVKDFDDPMDVIGYIYRCYVASKNAAATKRMNARLDEQMKARGLLEET